MPANYEIDTKDIFEQDYEIFVCENIGTKVSKCTWMMKRVFGFLTDDDFIATGIGAVMFDVINSIFDKRVDKCIREFKVTSDICMNILRQFVWVYWVTSMDGAYFVFETRRVAKESQRPILTFDLNSSMHRSLPIKILFTEQNLKDLMEFVAETENE